MVVAPMMLTMTILVTPTMMTMPVAPTGPGSVIDDDNDYRDG